jgi:DNA modification methylase
MRALGVIRFEEWTQGRSVSSFGTNSGATKIPFQGWHPFKEAFTPEIVSRAIAESQIEVACCLDPFGGSGTTALACQFLGVHPVTIEVNPYLADSIEAKLSQYNPDVLARDLRIVLRGARESRIDALSFFSVLPPTFLEPGVANRWIFNLEVANRLASLLSSINRLGNATHRRLFKVLLGGLLIEISNVSISGKGRRYRKGWDKRRLDPQKVDTLFSEAVHRAIVEIRRYAGRAHKDFELLRGDCRVLLRDSMPVDLVVFSPPYPNSFDYTDVYNVELWVLGYLNDRSDNQGLRRSTLCSHVQVSRNFPPAPSGSTTLSSTMDKLIAARPKLWSSWIPEMVGGYFSDLCEVLCNAYAALAVGGKVWMVVGDSRYAGVQIEAAKILAELAVLVGYSVDNLESFRSMRSSAQQGGRPELAEALLVLSKHG